MEKDKMTLKKVTPEMVDQFIEERYAIYSGKIDSVLSHFATSVDHQIDIEQIVSNLNAGRKELVKHVNHYEDELVRMIDLAVVLSDKYTECNREQYIDFLIEKNKEILPDLVEIIQLLKNK